MIQIAFAGPLNETEVHDSDINVLYVWGIAFVAALGGLLFGYDWVVIGGAKPFYEAYFHLESQQMVGWANSCALVGCFVGALAAGSIADRLGRKPVLLISAFLFAVSSLLTGWSHLFSLFVFWRILGGVAIGLASNVSPLYIAEVSPPKWRGRLVSLNQLALVVGILIAQVADWLIARPVPEHATRAMIAPSWNGAYGWRWMFSAVAIPAVLFFVCALALPESPRWLMLRGAAERARAVLTRIGGAAYASVAVDSIAVTLRESSTRETTQWSELTSPGVPRVLVIGITLAVLQQWSGINILFNYAQEVYRSAGYGVSDILFNIVITGAINLAFTLLAMLFVDRVGRRGLMIVGFLGVGISHFCAAMAYRAGLHGSGVLLLTLCAIACYALSVAPITWVLIAEIFPNRGRGVAISIAVAALWFASFALTYSFPLFNATLGTGGTFYVYSAVCFAGALFVYRSVSETKGRSLEQIEGDLKLHGS
jgi:SP family xylose:H+ symportor-like MFS transporter